MSHGLRLFGRTDKHLAAFAGQLGPPVPFTMHGLQSCLEQHSGRAVRLPSPTMPPGAPSGAWLQTDSTDFLFYEEQTSPFHQAHIVSSLAAHIVMGDKAAGTIASQLVPKVDLPLGRMIPGSQIGDAVSRAEAERFAIEVLRRSGQFPGDLRARRLLRRLRPLRSALLAAVPSAAQTTADPGVPRDATFRLYCAVIEIRDAALALRHDGSPGRAGTASTPDPLRRIADQSLGVAVQAAHLIRGLDREADGGRPDRCADVTSLETSRADLRFEAATLAKVSEAFVGQLGETIADDLAFRA